MAPSGTARSTPATACASPKDFSSPVVSIASGACDVMGLLTSAPAELLSSCQTQGAPPAHRSPATFCPWGQPGGEVDGAPDRQSESAPTVGTSAADCPHEPADTERGGD